MELKRRAENYNKCMANNLDLRLTLLTMYKLQLRQVMFTAKKLGESENK